MSDRKVDPIKTINKIIDEKQALSDELETAKAEIEKLTNLILDLTKKIKSASSAPAMCYDSSVEVIRKASIDNILREMEANR